MFRKKYFWAVSYGFLLLWFTIYVLLDTFVITRVYSDVSSGQNPLLEDTESENDFTKEELDSETVYESKDAVITDTTYNDSNISITINEYRHKGTDIYVADVKLSSAEYLKTALAQGIYGKNVTGKTSEIAEQNHGILAINGDYYGVQEKGYVLRNGVIYRSTAAENQEDLVIYDNGAFEIRNEEELSVDEVVSNGAVQILSFGPALLIDGTISVTEEEEVGKAMTSNPRTAIGMVDTLHYLFVVSDGRTKESEGLTLYELAEFMGTLGTETAYNLDGGGSSTLYFNGKVINKPTTNGKSIKERSVSDIVYIGY